MEQKKIPDLIPLCKAGDRDAQEELIRLTQNRVYYHCRKMLKQEQDALDATQDVLCMMLSGLDKLREPAAFWGWLNAITANHCKHILAHSGQVWQIPEDEMGKSMLDDIEDLDEQQVPDKALDNQETRRMILELIDALPPEQRICVLFYYYDEMRVKDIAQALGISEGTVKSRLNYARKSMKAGVEKYEKQGIKLYTRSPLLFLLYFLRQDAQQGMEQEAAQAMVQQVLSSASPVTGSVAAGTVSASIQETGSGAAAISGQAAEAGASAAGASGLLSGVSLKLVAGILAGVVLLGSGAVLSIALHRQPEQAPPSPPSVSENLPAAAESAVPSEEPFVVLQPRIQHTDWDQPTQHTEVYFEIPVFDNATGGYAVINAFFEKRQEAFFSPENAQLASALEQDSNGFPSSDTFSYIYFVMLHDCTEQVFSVTLMENWYMGGTVSGKSENYTFNPRTGALLKLSQLVSVPEEALQEQIVAALTEQYPGIESMPEAFAEIRHKTMDELNFYVEEGQLHIVFDKYEIATGSAGSFDVVLSVPLHFPS